MLDTKPQIYRFDDFELDVSNRQLLREGQEITLPAKAFDMLVVLVQNSGRLVEKNELFNQVWPDQVVEESNLTVQVSAIRKALDDRKENPRFIITVPGHGYRFTGQLKRFHEEAEEVIVERHSLTRVVVEAADPRLTALKKRWSPSRQRFKIGIFVLGLAVIGGLGVWYFGIRGRGVWQSAKPQNPVQREATQRVYATSGGGFPERVALAPDGKTIAFVEGRGPQTSLWRGDLESNNSIQIVPFSSRMYSYVRFSRDGKYIYFTAHDANHPKATLMRLSSFGGAIQDLKQTPDSFFSFSPDGATVAFLKNNLGGTRRFLVIADAESGKDIRVFEPGQPVKAVIGSAVSWSPDGRTIAFAGTSAGEKGTSIFGLKAGDGTITRIGDPVPNRIVNIEWLDDGKGLLVNRNTSNDANDGKIWLVPYPIGEPQCLTNDTQNYSNFSLSAAPNNRAVILNARIDPQIWIAPNGDLEKKISVLTGSRFRSEGFGGATTAPDGKVVYVAKSPTGNYLWEFDHGTGEQHQLTPSQDGADDAQPDVTPDGRYIVFDSNRSGTREIWRANRDGSGLTQLTTGGGNAQPAISPDGRWIIYTADIGSWPRLWRVSIDGGEPVKISDERAAWPTVSPDGKLIACMARELGDANANEHFIGLMAFEGGRFIKSFQIPSTAILYNRIRWSRDGQSILYKDMMQGLWEQKITAEAPQQPPGLDEIRVIHLGAAGDKLIVSGGKKMREIIILENFR
jgi:Tol biopolymer transport system component/DNA-binding winged helix-turn-helix (wHTH) protein